ncbi:hypothetical protein A3J15_03175 [Candidatus Roizmanbacteria bacterium RIFCSPLOWO2_02_FULL_38_10]|uniref:Methyltransferase type 11 domain-containing protein n=1 Tax=Candidatus Roizmanbacteria bacterium RIFCSPLOWO2_02_FULL_38_10 TaxID=1802074 RepID=A0A1F7JL70_9BACT|nr:MAG: hypothetical protein A3J15_03175 [Candidatus Roizmanbacteria bacterium RIFCSPLOWO2_02_FULL_38_10]
MKILNLIQAFVKYPVETSRLVFFYIYYRLTLLGKSSNYVYIMSCYRAVFRRTPDSDGLNNFLPRLESQAMTRSDFYYLLINSDEYSIKKMTKWKDPLTCLHQSRIEGIKHLPNAKIILDLGGAHSDSIEGALLAMGYPHKPEKIIIVDIPPKTRFFKTNVGHLEKDNRWLNINGKKIKYLHQNLTNLDRIQKGSIDMIWCGQSVEHITQKEFKTLLKDIRKVLKSGGYFCFDTPNRLITQIQSPDSLINPDHKYEYKPYELRQLLISNKYKILKEIGLCPMPKTLKTKKFDYEEMINEDYVSDNLDISYFSLFIAQKI